MRQDVLTSAQAVMDNDHAYIHEKKGFSASFNTGSLAAAALYKVAFTTPAKNKRLSVHLRPTSFSSTANLLKVAIYEDSVFTGGTIQQLRNRFREPYPVIAHSVLKVGATAALTGKTIVAAEAGGDFANQPAGDAVDVVSNSAADVGQIVTIYGTITGATTTVTSEQIVLNGLTAGTSTILTWQNILGVELSGVCAGTVTISENSGSATITTILTTVLSAGVATIAEGNARDTIIRHDASGASTKLVGVIGTAPDGTALSAVDALNGATEEDHGTAIFRTVTKVLIGDVAAATDVNLLRPEVLLFSSSVGSGGTSEKSGGSGGSMDEWVLQPATDYLFVFENIGTVTATTGYVDFFMYEESY